jgi:hypothetical protein
VTMRFGFAASGRPRRGFLPLFKGAIIRERGAIVRSSRVDTLGLRLPAKTASRGRQSWA